MNRWLALILVILALGAWKFRPGRGPGQLPAEPALLAAASIKDSGAQVADPCSGKQRCLVVYLAPWCPACKSVTPQLLQVRDHWKGSATRGIKFIVGADSDEKNRELALSIGDGAYVDQGDAYRRAMKVSHFPTLWVVDENSKVITADRGAYDWLNGELGAS
jgi:thiol-disulfide isomerase/thioredoxin